ALVIVLIGVIAWKRLRRSATVAAPLAVVALVMATTLAWAAAIVLDGLVDDWVGIPPLALDASGDGAADADIVAAFGRLDAAGTLSVRVDAHLVTTVGFTSANSTTFTTGTAGTFTVTTSGSPRAAISRTGALPSGVSFTDNGDGSATLA